MDLARERLWREERAIRLRPKSWDVLRYLVERPGLLVTKEAIHQEVWGGTAVSDDTLTQSIGELRRVLTDDPRKPRFIETVHRRGFRFIAQVERVAGASEAGAPAVGTASSTVVGAMADPAFPFVGRESVLSRLNECLRRAREGTRQLVFITGEAGIGKTSLAEAFLRSPALRGPDVLALHGQCIQQHGEREPYMPILEALERVLSSPAGEALRPQVRRVAPCWYAQMPALFSDSRPDELGALPINAPPERMLREGAAFLELLAARSTLVLLLEDLHWSDPATADLLSYVAQRQQPARLLIIGTYRPAEAGAYEHPIREVKQTLRVRRRCIELGLGYLSLPDIREYLGARFGDEMPALAQLVHERTDGNPLFVVAIVEELIRRGQLTETGGRWVLSVPEGGPAPTVPDDLMDMMASQLHSLGAEQRSMLEVASVVGARFDLHTVSRALGADVEDVEALAQGMARSRLFLSFSGHAEVTAVAQPYEFIHSLHRHMIYEQIADERRRRLHRTVGEALESLSGERAPEIAAELSVHFERGGEPARAVTHLSRCVARARQRFAPREALAAAAQAMGLLERMPETPTRNEQELEVRLLLGIPLSATLGYTSSEVRENYARARTLCEKVGHARQLFEIVHAAWYRELGGDEADGAWQSVEELGRIAEGLDADFRWRATLARGRTEFWNGQVAVAVPRLLRCVDEARDRVEVSSEIYGVDPIVAAFMTCAQGLWFLGRPDQARAYAQGGLARAERNGRPLDLASALCQAARIELLCGSAGAAAILAARALTTSTEHDVAYFLPVSRFLLGAVAADQSDVGGGLRQMLMGLAGQRTTTGPFLVDSSLALIAAAHGRLGQWDEGIRRADEGIELAVHTLERLYVAELWRVKGELIAGKRRLSKRRRGPATTREADAAVTCVRRALEIARQQGARSLELRSAMSLTRLSMGSEGEQEARDLLRSVRAAFTEGFDTKDLEEAQTLLGGPTS